MKPLILILYIERKSSRDFKLWLPFFYLADCCTTGYITITTCIGGSTNTMACRKRKTYYLPYSVTL